MSIYEHVTQFAGKPVVDWEPSTSSFDPATSVYRIRLSWDEAHAGQHWTDKFTRFLSNPSVSQLTAIVVGNWDVAGEDGNSARIVEALVTAREQLPSLKAIFLGDITSEENEISWINQSDVSPLLDAYPALEHFRVRGGQGLVFGSLRHANLTSLIVESGGLGAEMVHAVAAADLPQLEHLELWLGTEDYGGTTTVDDLAPILAGTLLPRLTYLGLRDSQIADAIAIAVANAPILERIKVLDLSLGTLSDEGAAALLASPAVARLEKLDLHHHYCSEAMVEKLQGSGINVDVSDPQQEEQYDGERWRYVAVSE